MQARVSAKRVILTSFFVDAVDILLNVTVVLLTGSVIIIAELLQGIADLIASGFLLVGLGRSRREVYLWSFLSALVMLLLASSLSFYFGLQRFLAPEPIDNIFIAYIALSISIVTNGYAFFLSVKRILSGRKWSFTIKAFWESPLLMTKNTFILDLMGMSAAIVGLIALVFYQITGDTRFDGLGAMGIGVVLAILSLNLIVHIWNVVKRKHVVGEV